MLNAELSKEQIVAYEENGAENGWTKPMTQEDRAFFRLFRDVFKRYNIEPAKASEMEYEFITQVTEREFYQADPRKSQMGTKDF